MKTLQEIRDALYSVNATNVSLYMIAMKRRDDKIIIDTNQCLGEILKWIDELIEKGGNNDTGTDHSTDR